ncbi:MAG: transposase [Halioglobus sp.]
MARLRRYCPAGIPQHVIQRGNNRSACFAAETDMAVYASHLHKAASIYGVAVHGWVFMTNHIHLLVTPEHETSLSRTMQHLGRHYVRYFNHKYQRTGTLFEGRFKSCIVQQSRYFLVCQRYIELNPVRAGMVRDPADYVWSSYRSHAFGRATKLWQPHPQYLSLATTGRERQSRYRALFAGHIEGDLLADIRQSINQGMALGSTMFRKEIGERGGRRQELLKRGPRPRRRG